MNRLERARRFTQERRSVRLASQITTRQLIKQGGLTDEEVLKRVGIYPEWKKEGHPYKVGDLFSYEGKLYKVIQGHISQADWLPNEVPALYKSAVAENIIPDWVKPTGAHDAINKGEQRVFEGQVWESLIDANTYSPTEYPAGWKLV